MWNARRAGTANFDALEADDIKESYGPYSELSSFGWTDSPLGIPILATIVAIDLARQAHGGSAFQMALKQILHFLRFPARQERSQSRNIRRTTRFCVEMQLEPPVLSGADGALF